jgi:hypothetical protein
MCFNQVLLLLLLLLFSSSSSSPLDPRTSNLRISQKLCKVLKQVYKQQGTAFSFMKTQNLQKLVELKNFPLGPSRKESS